MHAERHPCENCHKPARLVQMTLRGDTYDCACGHRTFLPLVPLSKEERFDCIFCQDTGIVGQGDPCPHCEDREFLNSVTRW